MDDLISRQKAIDVVLKHYRVYDNDLLAVILYRMEKLPSAQTELNQDQLMIKSSVREQL